MPPRRDYAVLMAIALSDPRVARAAALYVASGIARRETAQSTVRAHLAEIGFALSQRGDDGCLGVEPADFVRKATQVSERVAARILAALSDPSVDLVTGDPSSPRLRGFDDAYRPLLERRAEAVERARKSRDRCAQRARTLRATDHPEAGACARALARVRPLRTPRPCAQRARSVRRRPYRTVPERRIPPHGGPLRQGGGCRCAP